MHKKTLVLIAILVAVPLMFMSVRSLLQDPDVYYSTLGNISDNYTVEGKQYGGKIMKADIPFIDVSKDNIYNWDGAFYSILRDSLYTRAKQHPDRLAFFPLYPLVLKTIPRASPVVFFFNYLLFALGVLLIAMFSFGSQKINIAVFVIGLLLPTVVMFYIPYAECLLMLTFAIAVAGLYKGKYWLYFLGIVAFSMTRPSLFIFIMALAATDIAYFLQHRNLKYFIKEFLLKLLPALIGFAIVAIIQYIYKGSFTAYFEANDIWQTESGFFGNEISDWSAEGFGMDTFAIFFVMIPALFFASIWMAKSALQKEKKVIPASFSGNTLFAKDYLFVLSIFFMIGNILMLLLTSGGALNGYARYTMAVPFFYIILFQLPERLAAVSLKIKLAVVLFSLVLMGLFLAFVNYSGDLLRFEYCGLYILLAIMLYLIFESYMPSKLKVLILIILLLPCIIWQTYLFNMYLSNAWIYT